MEIYNVMDVPLISPLLSVAESDNGDVMTGLLERLMKIPGISLVHRCKLGGVITSHGGPGTFGISFVKA